MMILKVTKKQGFTLNLKDTVSKRPWGAGGGVVLKFTPPPPPPSPPSCFRVKEKRRTVCIL